VYPLIYGLNGPRFESRQWENTFLLNTQTGFRAHTASYLIGTEAFADA